MSVIIRTATPGSAQLPRIIGGRAAGPEEWDQWSEEPGHDLVAQDDSRVVGGLHVSLVSRSEAWLENLRVHPDVWGRGIAVHLVKEGEAVARRYGAAVARTAIPAHEYAAQAVAERAGYKPLVRCRRGRRAWRGRGGVGPGRDPARVAGPTRSRVCGPGLRRLETRGPPRATRARGREEGVVEDKKTSEVPQRSSGLFL